MFNSWVYLEYISYVNLGPAYFNIGPGLPQHVFKSVFLSDLIYFPHRAIFTYLLTMSSISSVFWSISALMWCHVNCCYFVSTGYLGGRLCLHPSIPFSSFMYLFLHNQNNTFLKHNLKPVGRLRGLHGMYRFCWGKMSYHSSFPINWILLILDFPLCPVNRFLWFSPQGSLLLCQVCSSWSLYNLPLLTLIYFLPLVNSDWLWFMFGSQLALGLF